MNTKTAVANVTGGALKHLDNALGQLASLGIVTQQDDNAPVVAIINQVKGLSEEKALVIARTLQHQSHFAQIVRDEITAMNISNRHELIAERFNSIREDGKRMLAQMEDGRISFGERIQNGWMNMTRGDIPSRFKKIQSVYVEVMKDSQDQIQRENVILGSYSEFRIALKEAEIAAHELFKAATTERDKRQEVVNSTQEAIKSYTGDDAAERARLELSRDEAIADFKKEDDRFQKVKNLADGLTVSYAATETVMGRLDQTHQIKSKLYDQGVTFFSTMESVMTGMSAALTSLHGLHETNQTVENMRDGINMGLEDLADMGSAIQLQALKTAHGPTLQVQSVKKLVDAVVDFQSKSVEIIREQRELSTQNAKEIAQVVEEGQQRYAALINQG